ncbi:MAG: beta-N-acetylhexosaminidase [Tannerella sp.]|jgi:hexosaminidase|nr:beta-N-acetylhexosaminidase [Tannerella sp.]
MDKKIKKLVLVSLLAIQYSAIAIAILFFAGCAEKTVERDLNILPYPKKMTTCAGDFSFEISNMGVKVDAETQALSQVIKDDLYRLSGVEVKEEATTVVDLSVQSGVDKGHYQVKVSSKGIRITGNSYQAVVCGWTSVLQTAVIEGGRISIPEMEIDDSPDLEYRGLMIDLARSFHSYHTVKQMIDLCRWYKINYLHLHLTDDQLFVFPSAKFPDVINPDFCYTREQLREIVEYAHERGVNLVPELEGPGHSSNLRNAYPEIFGKPEYDCIDLSDEKVLDAMKSLIGEVIDAFPYSTHIHIGADEVNLEALKKLPHVIEAVKRKSFNDVHDLYLNYIVEMHKFIQSKGKQTCLWEGFDKDGSEAVKIPKDVLVFEFESLYQRPDSLVKNGYNLINTSWLPLYLTQSKRWSPEEIYNWNYYTWKNWWEKSHATKTPIIIDEQYRAQILGAQMCAWELNDEMEYPSLSGRLAAMSERLWDTIPVGDYAAFEKRMKACQTKLNQLLYPIQITTEGLTEPDYVGNDNNRENFFTENVTLSVKSLLPETVVRYTADGLFPSQTSAIFPESLIINESTLVKIGLYDRQGKLISYYPVFYDKKPIIKQ